MIYYLFLNVISHICKKCDPGFYSLKPEWLSCKPCPKGGNCMTGILEISPGSLNH